MSDLSNDRIVKSLRFVAKREAEEGEYHVQEHIDWMAADRIERQAKRIAELEARFKSLWEATQTPYQQLWDKNDKLKSENERLQAKVERLEGALRSCRYEPIPTKTKEPMWLQYSDNIRAVTKAALKEDE